MRIKELLKGFVEDVNQLPDGEITGIAIDSRKVKPGYLFISIHGHQLDGRDYIPMAIKNGAKYIVTDRPDTSLIYIPKLATHIGEIASRYYGYPGKQLLTTGITGTNGKTTIAYLLTQALDALGRDAAYIGTLGAGMIGEFEDTGMTTPGPLELQSFCASFVKSGVSELVMEVSSHALHQDRTAGLNFRYAIYTNLTHDHLDYHPSFAHYAECKAKLFQMPDLEAIIVNIDDSNHELMLKHANPKAKVYTYGINEEADVAVERMHWTLDGMHLTLVSPWGKVKLQTSLLGHFNIYNALAVFTCLMVQGFNLEDVLLVMKNLKSAPGRMEVCAKHPLVIVDYAHTPDALENALMTLKQFKEETNAGKLWVVFGCGGNRDPFKRPIMGQIAAKLADSVIVTSDNPRHEEPLTIMNQITAGLNSTMKLMQIEDRKLAIMTCLEQAKADDIILIAGKGHEAYQQIGDEKLYFSDQAVVVDFLNPLPR